MLCHVSFRHLGFARPFGDVSGDVSDGPADDVSDGPPGGSGGGAMTNASSGVRFRCSACAISCRKKAAQFAQMRQQLGDLDAERARRTQRHAEPRAVGRRVDRHDHQVAHQRIARRRERDRQRAFYFAAQLPRLAFTPFVASRFPRPKED
ncbi:MAG TPA: hypothetical protein VIA18_25655 [Polyangia bacterium]|nr:hypothetical protein [Polyangia bacterium]